MLTQINLKSLYIKSRPILIQLQLFYLWLELSKVVGRHNLTQIGKMEGKNGLGVWEDMGATIS